MTVKSLATQIAVSIITSAIVISLTIAIAMALDNRTSDKDIIITETFTFDNSWWSPKYNTELPCDAMWKVNDHWYTIRELMGRKI